MTVFAPKIVLSIDTCGPSGSIALGRVDAETVDILGQRELAGKTYSAQFIPVLRTMLGEEGIEASILEAVVVVNGPGSFTGMRVGVSSAKGLAEALGIPLLPVSRLAVLAWKAESHRAALDAGRGEFYFRECDYEYLLGAKGLPLNNLESIAVCEPCAQRVFVGAVSVEPPTAEDALCYSVPGLLAHDFADVEALDGNYLRRSNAEIFGRAVEKV